MEPSELQAFRRWNDLSSNEVILLRPKPITRQDAFDGDYDYLVNPRSFARLYFNALQAGREASTPVVVNQNAPRKRVLTFGPKTGQQIKCELWPHAELVGPDGRKTTIHWQDLQKLAFQTESLRTALAAIYVTHLHYKNKDLNSPEVNWRLNWFKANLHGFHSAASSDISTTLDDLAGGRTDKRNANISALQVLERLDLTPSPDMRGQALGKYKKLTKLAPRHLRRHAIMPVVGPDGVGKTTIVEGFVQAEGSGHRSAKFKRLFRHWAGMKPAYLINKAFPGVFCDQGRPLKNNELDERFSWAAILVATLTYRFLQLSILVQPLRSKPSQVALDRFFWDYLVKPRASTDALMPTPGARWLVRITPKPKKIVICVAAPALIRSRKRELTSSVIEGLYEHYVSLLASNRATSALFLPCDNNLEDEVARLIEYANFD